MAERSQVHLSESRRRVCASSPHPLPPAYTPPREINTHRQEKNARFSYKPVLISTFFPTCRWVLFFALWIADSSGFRVEEGFLRPGAAAAANPCVSKAVGGRVTPERPGQTGEGVRRDGVLVVTFAKVRMMNTVGFQRMMRAGAFFWCTGIITGISRLYGKLYDEAPCGQQRECRTVISRVGRIDGRETGYYRAFEPALEAAISKCWFWPSIFLRSGRRVFVSLFFFLTALFSPSLPVGFFFVLSAYICKCFMCKNPVVVFGIKSMPGSSTTLSPGS